MMKMRTDHGDITFNDDNSVETNEKIAKEIEDNLVENDNQEKPKLNLQIKD